jgi:hypothetical protein
MHMNIFAALRCHPERSEGSKARGNEMLRCAQHDKGTVSLTEVWPYCHTVRPSIDQACSQCMERSTARFQPA